MLEAFANTDASCVHACLQSEKRKLMRGLIFGTKGIFEVILVPGNMGVKVVQGCNLGRATRPGRPSKIKTG